MEKPTREEVERELAELKRIEPILPPSMFGDNNQAYCRAEQGVLERYLQDGHILTDTELSEQYADIDVESTAQYAACWIEGDDYAGEGAMSDLWKEAFEQLKGRA